MWIFILFFVYLLDVVSVYIFCKGMIMTHTYSSSDLGVIQHFPDVVLIEDRP